MRNLKSLFSHSVNSKIFLLPVLLLIFSMSAGRAFAGEPETITVGELIIDTSDMEFSNDDAAVSFINRTMSGAEMENTRKGSKDGSGAAGLNVWEKNLYDALKAQAYQVATGTRASTILEVPFAMIFGANSCSYEELGITVHDGWFAKTVDFANVIRALLVDCPYDLYWYDKALGSSTDGYKYSLSENTIIFPESPFLVKMSVAAEFRPENALDVYTFNTTYGKSAVTAADTARDIVTTNAEKSDVDKLIAYKDAICGLTSYNEPAEATSDSYGNPWQMIWVFDNDPETTVVCEGYSKAFQYLCDNSAFQSSKIKSMIVTGTMGGGTGAGGHMWNIVTLADGRNYIADITNSDEGTIGSRGQVFLKKCKTIDEMISNGKAANIYYFSINSARDLYYIFDDDIVQLYVNEDLNIYDIASDYTGDVKWSVSGSGILTISGSGVISSAPWSEIAASVTKVVIGEGIIRISCESNPFSGSTLSSISYPQCSAEIDTWMTATYSGTPSILHPAPHSLIYFSSAALICAEDGYEEYWQCSNCGRYFSDKNATKEISAPGHDWCIPSYNWTTDNSEVTAVRICQNNDSHIETETVSAKRDLIKAPTMEEDGCFVIISSEFKNPAFEVQTKDILSIPALNKLNVLELPASLTTVETEAFVGIAAEAIIIPESCATIESEAFMNCTDLIYVRIPAGTNVAENAFIGCPKVVIDKLIK